jgi:hypothetical protein
MFSSTRRRIAGGALLVLLAGCGSKAAAEQLNLEPTSPSKADATGCHWAPSTNPAINSAVVHGVKYLLYVQTCPNSVTSAWVPQISG